MKLFEEAWQLLAEAGEEKPTTLSGKRAVMAIKDFAEKQKLVIKQGPYSMAAFKWEAEVKASTQQWIRCSIGNNTKKQTHMQLFLVEKDDATDVKKLKSANVLVTDTEVIYQ